ncbi:cupin domain-containing protein [Pedobacter antarcticus]|uniref:cupin domain-containing protein n=1 Tax=Pedobacter antarcticus TaxID=34086 RepID=UPI00292E11A8|nr:cupin domain-containing protein [Pedobacter antarcticus]
MNLQTYIESGILELYVLNMLDETTYNEVQDCILKYPELTGEIASIEKALENYALQNAVEPSAALKAKIEQALFTTSINFSQGEVVPINELSDYHKWLDFVSAYFPEALNAENFAELVTDDQRIKQVLVVSSFDIDEESHADEYESFLILKGRCRCTVDNEVFYLEPGGYTQIPLNTNHRVEIIEGPVMAIVQYRTAFS